MSTNKKAKTGNGLKVMIIVIPRLDTKFFAEWQEEFWKRQKKILHSKIFFCHNYEL